MFDTVKDPAVREALFHLYSEIDARSSTSPEQTRGHKPQAAATPARASGGMIVTEVFGTTLTRDLDAGAKNITGAGLITSSTATFGTAPNTTAFEADGSLVMSGNATVWEDLRVDITNSRVAASAPTWTTFLGNTGAWVFPGNKPTGLLIAVQFPHSMKVNSKIFPHVHWAPYDATAGRCAWTLEYTWANFGQVFPATTTTKTQACVSSAVAKTHQIDSMTEITPGVTGGGISSILLGYLYRDTASANDNLNATNVWLLAFDFHIEHDTLGSRQEFIK